MLYSSFRTPLIAITFGTSFWINSSALAFQAPGGASRPPQVRDSSGGDAKGLPPRAAPSEYQAHEKAGELTIAAEFVGNSVPTPEAIYTSDDYVVVEAALFGTGSAKVSLNDFSLRINGNKKSLPAQPVEFALKSLKDPDWEPPNKKGDKGKTSFGGGGGGQEDSSAAPVRMPFELRRPMEQRVQRGAMLEGERPLPQAGLLFFEHRGKVQNIRSVELIYTGPAGTATLRLQP